MQAGVTDVDRRVAGLLERAQDERGEGDAPCPGATHMGVDTAGDLTDQVGCLCRKQGVGHRRRGHAKRGELLHQPADALRIGALVDSVQTRDLCFGELARDRFVGGDHQMLDQTMGLGLRTEHNRKHVAAIVKGELGLLGVDHERPTGLAGGLQRGGGGSRGSQRSTPRLRRARGAGKDTIDLLVIEAHV